MSTRPAAVPPVVQHILSHLPSPPPSQTSATPLFVAIQGPQGSGKTFLTEHVASSLTQDAHAIYILNLLLAFLQPKFDPSVQDDLMADEIEEGGSEEQRSPLPSSRDDEFRPFVRRLPEWQFWYV